jgi:hypothetical protein
MKKLIFSVLVLVLTSVVALADRALVLETRSGGGFAPPPLTAPKGLQIYDDGQVIWYQGYGDAFKKEVLATLSDVTLARLRQKIESIKDRELRDTTPNAPRCADAPSTGYSVFKGPEAIGIYRWNSCHEFVPVDAAAQSLVEITNALMRLR